MNETDCENVCCSVGVRGPGAGGREDVADAADADERPVHDSAAGRCQLITINLACHLTLTITLNTAVIVNFKSVVFCSVRVPISI